ncbi:hypothetical protein [Paraburkholderia adhaesiva]|uniref:hypothetical protein n=1 Tax=Paraburkholderia adhaesiva TaxID=2883244 RepID=UPI001F198E9F|nr:hypothetical protein [Paraburkholderia adhaesiva]
MNDSGPDDSGSASSGLAGQKEVSMLEATRLAAFQACDWLTAEQVSRRASPNAGSPRGRPDRWKQDGEIFSVRHGQSEHFPSYGLDPDRQYQPVAALADVLRAFGDTKDGWHLAFWFASVNSWLDGRRPLDLLATQFERVIAAAHAEAGGVWHG